MAAEVTGVKAGSPAARAGIKAGDTLISVNGHEISDVLDYMYYSSENTVVLYLKRDKKHLILKINKSEYDDLGMEFASFLMDNKQSCRNKCVFCFIDQMPEGRRETLYFKDDDARLSFLHGNYITLTNLTQEDIDRIIKMKIGINISVHTTNPELRCMMMNNRFAGEKLSYLKQLADAGISMNCQIVLCPGLNDGEELVRTLNDLGGLMPNISSIAVVPVGLTRFRDGLYPLTLFSSSGAAETIRIIGDFQRDFLEKYGTRLVYPSDEFYLISGIPLPDGEAYEDYPQYENGVGMMRSLYDEFFAALEESAPPAGERDISIATGAAAYDLISVLAEAVTEKYPCVKCRVYKIINLYFGETITVAGLLTAEDITEQLEGRELGTELLLSRSMIIHDGDLFLDDRTIAEVSGVLGVKLTFCDNDGKALLDAILGRSK